MKFKNSRENQANLLYKKYKRRAKSRGQKFNLSLFHFLMLTKLPCTYCGIKPKQVYNITKIKKYNYFYNGLDRIDSSKGYTLMNVTPACFRCNGMKSKMSFENFVEQCRLIAKHYFRQRG